MTAKLDSHADGPLGAVADAILAERAADGDAAVACTAAGDATVSPGPGPVGAAVHPTSMAMHASSVAGSQRSFPWLSTPQSP